MSDPRQSPPEPEPLDPLPAEVEARLAQAFAAAVRPSPLAAARHEAILAACLEDPFRPASDAERQAAAELSNALASGAEHPDAGLARSLQHAAGAGPRASAVEAALDRALPVPVPARTRSNVIFAAFGAGAGLVAIAAAIAVVVGSVGRTPELSSARHDVELATSRSLAPLFAGEGSELSASARIDRIEAVRAKELRHNRYLAWGVR